MKRIEEARTNLVRCRDLVGLGQKLFSLTEGLVDPSDIYRAAWGQAVAALDHYIHGIVLDRSVLHCAGHDDFLKASRVAPLPRVAVANILAAPHETRILMLKAHLAEALSKETFQSPDDIAKALASVGAERIWSRAFPNGCELIKKQLQIVSGRRNRIVHQFDTDPLNPGQPSDLTDDDALLTVNFIAEVIDALNEILEDE